MIGKHCVLCALFAFFLRFLELRCVICVLLNLNVCSAPLHRISFIFLVPVVLNDGKVNQEQFDESLILVF